MSDLETRVRRLERRNYWLALAVVGLCLALASMPKASADVEKTVQADEVLAKAVDVEQLTVTRAIILKDEKGKGSVALTVRKADAGPGIIVQSPDFEAAITEGGIAHRSKQSKAMVAMVWDAKSGSYRVVSRNAKGEVEVSLP